MRVGTGAWASNLHWLTKESPSKDTRNIIGRNPSMVIPLLANQDLTPMLGTGKRNSCFNIVIEKLTRTTRKDSIQI